MHKRKRFSLPLYFGWLNIVISDDFEASAKKLNLPIEGYNLKCYGAITWGIHNKKNVTEYYLMFSEKPSHMSIAHESLHVMNWIFHDRGITLDTKNDEPQAYLMGWIAEKVYKSIGK